MKRLKGTETKALLILSIVVPVGLVISFRLTGMFNEPSNVERITLEPVTLTLSRPSETTTVTNTSVQNERTQEGLSILVGVKIYSYQEGPKTPPPYYGNDGLMFQTYVNASFSQGRIDNIKISLHLLDGKAVLFVSEERWDLLAHNATLTALQYWAANETDAYIKATVLNSPVSISDAFYWVFLDENESHELEINVEIAHTDENAIKIVTIPVELKMTSSGES